MTHPRILSRQKTGLLLLDMQEKFRPAIGGFDPAAHNAVKLILAFQLFRMPVLVTEQYPKGLGKTIEPIARQFKPFEPIEKLEFACTANEAFWRKLRPLKIDTLVLCGVETHVCINQTALGLMQKGMRVQVVADAVASRRPLDHETALRKMEQAGVVLTTTETALYELCGKAGTAAFKHIQRMVKAKFTGWKPAPPDGLEETASFSPPSAPAGGCRSDGLPAGKAGASGTAGPAKRTADDETVLLDSGDTGAYAAAPASGAAGRPARAVDDETVLLGEADSPSQREEPANDRDAARRIASVLEEDENIATRIPAGMSPDLDTKVFRMTAADMSARETQPLPDEPPDAEMEDLLTELEGPAKESDNELPVV